MTSNVANRSDNLVKRKKSDVFERLSADKRKSESTDNSAKYQSSKTSTTTTKSRKSSLPNHKDAITTSKSKPPNSSSISMTQKSKPGLPRQKKDIQSSSIEPPKPLKGKIKKHEKSSDNISEKSLMENIPENADKDTGENSEPNPLIESVSNLDTSKQLHTSIYSSTDFVDSNVIDISDSITSCSSSSQVSSSVSFTEYSDGSFEQQTEILSPMLVSSVPNYITPLDHHSSSSEVDQDRIRNGVGNKECFPNRTNSSSFIPPQKTLTGRDILKEMKQNKLKKVEDQDKDTCDDDKRDEDDDEFYKIKVQTRLVSYENSTLVIRNTSKSNDDVTAVESEAAPDVEEETPTIHLHDSLSSSSSASLHSSSSELTMPEEEGPSLPSNVVAAAAETRSSTSAVRNRLGQFVTKGKLMLSDVRNSAYMPDVRAPLNRLQSVTRRSFRSMIKGFPPETANPTSGDRVVKRDSGYSSLNFALGDEPGQLQDQETTEGWSKATTKTTRNIGPINGAESFSNVLYKTEKNNNCDSVLTRDTNSLCHFSMPVPNPSTVTVAHEMPTSYTELPQGDSPNGFLDSPSEYPSCTDFFSSCYCSGLSASEKSNLTPHEQSLIDYCSCRQESLLPLEIKEILDCDHARMWWTITGNFGNILPIDWSKSYTRQKYLPVLNLNEAKKLDGNGDSLTPSPRVMGQEDEDEVANDLDLHQLILAGSQTEPEPLKSAEEVIKEIDDIMQEGSSSEDEGIDASSSGSNSSSRLELRKLPPPLYHDKLKELNVNELNETVMELEAVIRQYSETLISQLAHRDELEYEKELKNTFISLLLQVQNKRRNYNMEKKRMKKPLGPYGTEPKYLTTVIPYDVGHGPPSNQIILMLIKILTAINGDIPTVPTLLTDYILKVLCPSAS